jgi:hypothetical protein
MIRGALGISVGRSVLLHSADYAGLWDSSQFICQSANQILLKPAFKEHPRTREACVARVAKKGVMDEEKAEEIGRRAREEFQLGRASLFKVSAEKKARAEISQRKELLFANFKQQGLTKQLELTEALERLLMNFNMLASYRGILKGQYIFSEGFKLGGDRARFYLLEYLQTHPEADNKELVRYLDRKNGRLKSLKTNKDSPLWARLPRSLEEKFDKRKIPKLSGEFWETALREFPDPTMQYLSRARKKAKEASVKNVLFNWPRVIEEHQKRRKAPKG